MPRKDTYIAHNASGLQFPPLSFRQNNIAKYIHLARITNAALLWWSSNLTLPYLTLPYQAAMHAR